MQRQFRVSLYRHVLEAGYADAREAHLQVFGNIDWGGTRLTELAARANMTLASMAELVDELEEKGYLARKPDPTDGRAKLITLTRKGRRAVTHALRATREIERNYADVIGRDRFDRLCESLQSLLDAKIVAVAPDTDRAGPARPKTRT